ncbi:nicotinamide riboside transporter PnuC [uncultured Hymenobacter sp.]|uniref:nicotinamide riboside transporter PnuC n=1 Tax=uncultured Hymenobacter sp. TaxID=170016 RepID=UPI0035CADB55
MSLPDFYHFWTSAAGGTPLEWVAVLTGFACVWLAARESLWNFPVAIVSCGLYVLVYHRTQLYSDRNLQVFFILFNLYGWYEWRFGGRGRTALPVTRTRPAEWAALALFAAVFTLGSGYYFAHRTDAALPYWDSFTTGGSLVGQYLLMRKRLENWLVWIVVDIIYVPILWFKQLYPTTALYALYLGLAVYGYLEWRRALRPAVAPAPAAKLPV